MSTVFIKPSRESVTSIRRDGSRNFLRPADVRGRFTLARRAAAAFLILVYILLPWIPVNGHPAVFLDVLGQRFHLFGFTFAFQDIWLGFFFITGLGFTLFFITAMFGRVWCGWACPHTVFLEHVYRRIERLFEGNHVKQKQLDNSRWNKEKILRRGGKHVVFLILSALIANIFISYFISIPTLYSWILSGPSQHWGAFVFVLVLTLILYFNFSWFREQLCLILCPYGRLQSALIDDDSLIIGYDAIRGEPRGKATVSGNGDCVDCYRCVQVCPTGIDIRQGLQIECIGCANCIDACDDIMTKLNRPRGLIRYDSENGLAGKPRRFIRPRFFLYSFLLLLGVTVMTFSLSRLSPVYLSAIRMPGEPFYISKDEIRNQYLLRAINKTDEVKALQVVVNAEGIELELAGWDGIWELAPQAQAQRPLVVQLPKQNYRGGFPFYVILKDGDRVLTERRLEFVGPDPRLLAP